MNYIHLQNISISRAQAPDNLKNGVVRQDSLFLRTLAEAGEIASIDAQVMLWQAGLENYLGVIQFPENNSTERRAVIPKVSTATKTKVAASDLINVYPNPAKDMFVVEYYLLENRNNNIELFSLDGKLLKTIAVNKRIGFEAIYVKDIAPGNYIVKFGNKNVKKITIIH